jgi:hypothetical protein
MSGPIVRTGTTPEFWKNYDNIFGDKKKSAAPKKAAAKPVAAAAKSAAAKPAKKAAKKVAKKK